MTDIKQRMKRRRIFPLIFSPAVLLLLVSPGSVAAQVEVYNLRPFTHPTHTRIAIDIGQLREYHSNRLVEPDRVYIDIYEAQLNPILHGKTILVDNGYIRDIRIAQKNKSTVRVVVDFDFDKIDRYQVWHLFDPFRIVIDIYPKKIIPSVPTGKPAATPVQPAKPLDSGYSLARQLGLGIRRIVIDPGHGGTDPGCVGKTGVYEKDIVLDVCVRLKQLLKQQKGLEVFFTRESDIFIPPENRTVIANQKQADLFISVHANANPRKNFYGIATFFLNFSADPAVTEIAALENATSTKNIGDMKNIIEKIVKNSKMLESRELAQSIQSQLIQQLSGSYKYIKDLGVRGGPFWVLIGGEMPSVLIEISHLSHSREEERLKSPQYRQQIAQGIFNGIVRYIRSLGKG
ncbi:MAG: N-acetylmuramoyl-L-alanine amidase [Candidatus Aminicenantes bacterium]|nr:N-acetylmuramoyl-L-alanine amidase [Candidatus Aminicenantes bacterium]